MLVGGAMQIYLVGGAVRDQLLGDEVTERDWVIVGAKSDDLLDMGYSQVGKDFPVFLHPETKEEYALARTERKAGKGYTEFQCFADPSVTLEDDLKRRDLTINAIAQDSDGKIIDPYNGYQDLQNKIIRHVSESFTEDPLRVLRLARFAAKLHPKGFTIASETKKLLLEMVRMGELAHLTPSRVWQELYKVLQQDRADIFFTVLRECGALKVLFKEIDNLYGVPAQIRYHPEVDTGIHTMLSLEAVAKMTDSVAIRFAVLCHDFGKALTYESKWPAHHGHDARGREPILDFCTRYPVPNSFRNLAVTVAMQHILIHQAAELTAKRKLQVLEDIDVFRRPNRLQEVLLACKADALGRLRDNDFNYSQENIWNQCYEIAKSVGPREIIEQGFTKEEIGQQLRIARINKIKRELPNANNR